jgi:hypothetical protein
LGGAETQALITDVDELFTGITTWNAAPCAEELQVDIAEAAEALASAINAHMAGDSESFNGNCISYAIAMDRANWEYERLVQLLED